MPVQFKKLARGDRVNLSKESGGKQHFRVALGWEESPRPGEKIDLDVSLFGLADSGELKDGKPVMKLIDDRWFVFYNSETRTSDNTTTFVDENEEKKGLPASPCLGIIHSGDNQTGNAAGANGDAETVFFDGAALDARVALVPLIVSRYQKPLDVRRYGKLTFGQVQQAYVRVYNEDSGDLLAQYMLSEDFKSDISVHAGSFYRENGDTFFEAVGQGYPDRELDDFYSKFQA
ncbi:TerD family protein [Paraburkholderia sp. UCT31]|uniref:TerD family protein n=1 Tax=Paraburkholderia sp. UCT31 TaxID=2615209 RepID=UPI00165544A4|nr:TerD family protein [Paraburkholderia sp. UCT31]MBC8741823.1 TerD family protein [Paraburkholderia sp. UCT31]